MNTTSQSPGNTGSNSTPPQDPLQNLQDDARAALASAKEQGSARFEQYRDTAVEQIETLAHSAQSAAEQMQGSDTLNLSHYVTDVAQSMTTLASNLRGKSIDEMLHQASRLARDNPALFVTGSVALGFGLSRFLRASSPGGAVDQTSSRSARDQPGSAYRTEPGSALPQDENAPDRNPHVGDVYHSARPGVVDRDATPDAATGSFAASEPLGSQSGDMPSGDGQRKEGQPKGDV